MGQVAGPNHWPCKVRDSLGTQCCLILNHQGQHMTEAEVTSASPDSVAVVSYPGRTQADAAALFSRHAGEMAQQGYRPVAQSWGEGRPGLGRVLALGDASLAIKPKGFLSVTYELRPEQPAGSAAPNPIDQLRRLAELRDAGVVTPDEFEAKKVEMLSRL